MTKTQIAFHMGGSYQLVSDTLRDMKSDGKSNRAMLSFLKKHQHSITHGEFWIFRDLYEI